MDKIEVVKEVLVVKPYTEELHQQLRALGEKFDRLSTEIARQMCVEPAAFLSKMANGHQLLT